MLDLSAICGALLGLLACLLFVGMARAHAAPPGVYAAMPTPDQITAYAGAIVSAVMGFVNLVCWIQRKIERKRKPKKPRPRKKREAKPDGAAESKPIERVPAPPAGQ